MMTFSLFQRRPLCVDYDDVISFNDVHICVDYDDVISFNDVSFCVDYDDVISFNDVHICVDYDDVISFSDVSFCVDYDDVLFIPATSTFVETHTLGPATNGVSVNSFHADLTKVANITMKISVTADDCTPVSASSYGVIDGGI